MSDRMGVSEAREWLPMAESHDVNANISRLLRTAISQAEQIERLQEAIRVMSYPCAGELIGLMEKGVVHPEDMESPA